MAKRAFDIVVSLLLLILTAPLWIVMAVLVRLSSPGPIFYTGPRVGMHGRRFAMLKFRTMRPATGPHAAVTSENDPRITRIGALMRKWKLDELPQLLNVLRGDMSIVGPRPEDPRYVALYTPEQRRVLDVRPGCAHLAFFRNEQAALAEVGEDFENVYATRIMPEKLRIELEYVERRSFAFDLSILRSTLSCIIGLRPAPLLRSPKQRATARGE